MTSNQTIQAILNDISTYNLHSKERLSIDVHRVPTVESVIDIYIGEHRESSGLPVREAHFLIMGMLVEQMRQLERIYSEGAQ